MPENAAFLYDFCAGHHLRMSECHPADGCSPGQSEVCGECSATGRFSGNEWNEFVVQNLFGLLANISRTKPNVRVGPSRKNSTVTLAFTS